MSTWSRIGFALAMTILALGCVTAAKSVPEIGHHYVVRCHILGDGGRLLRSYPGKMCIFLKDGSFVAATDDPIRVARIGPTGTLLWSRPLHLHHQLKLSADGKKLLTLGAETREGDLGRVRYDDFLVLSLETGETIHRWSGYEHRLDYLKLVDGVPARIRPPAGRENLDYIYEYTHFNSIAEIPENPTSKVIPAFKAGNYVVGLNGIGKFAIFDPELKTLLWTMDDPLFDGDPAHNDRPFHDLQILSNGHLLVFNNRLGLTVQNSYFSVRELDPVTHYTVWKFPADDSIQVSVSGGGGVEYLPEGVLLNLNPLTGDRKHEEQETGVAYLITRDGKVIWSMQEPAKEVPFADLGRNPVGDFQPNRNPFQDIKKFDLSEFLRNSKIN